MTTQVQPVKKRYFSLALAIGSVLCFHNTALAQNFNWEKLGREESATFQLATQSSNYLSNQNLECLHYNKFQSSPETQLAQVIIDSRPSYDSRCGSYYTIQKYGKYYECIKCEYNREPYCWERNDLN